jgi:hypothetical protein
MGVGSRRLHTSCLNLITRWGSQRISQTCTTLRGAKGEHVIAVERQLAQFDGAGTTGGWCCGVTLSRWMPAVRATSSHVVSRAAAVVDDCRRRKPYALHCRHRYATAGAEREAAGLLLR